MTSDIKQFDYSRLTPSTGTPKSGGLMMNRFIRLSPKYQSSNLNTIEAQDTIMA